MAVEEKRTLSTCSICGYKRLTKLPGNRCTRCKSRSLPAEDIEFILTAARKVWASDEFQYQERIKKEGRRDHQDSHSGKVRAQGPAQGGTAKHGPAGLVHRGRGRAAGPVKGHGR